MLYADEFTGRVNLAGLKALVKRTVAQEGRGMEHSLILRVTIKSFEIFFLGSHPALLCLQSTY